MLSAKDVLPIDGLPPMTMRSPGLRPAVIASKSLKPTEIREAELPSETLSISLNVLLRISAVGIRPSNSCSFKICLSGYSSKRMTFEFASFLYLVPSLHSHWSA